MYKWLVKIDAINVNKKLGRVNRIDDLVQNFPEMKTQHVALLIYYNIALQESKFQKVTIGLSCRKSFRNNYTC